MTIPGIPVVYYGDEFGMPGGNDPDCRRMMRFDEQLVKREQETRDAVAQLGQLRKNQLPLIYGDFIELTLDKNIWAYARNYFGKTVIVVFNRNTIPFDITIQLPAMFEGKKYTSTFGSEFTLDKDMLKVLVKANGVEILVEK
jgi:glycosidase